MPPIPPIVWKALGVLAAMLLVAAGAFYEGHHLEAQVFQDYKDQQMALAEKQVASNQTAVAAITASEAEGLRQIAASRQEQANEVQKRNDALVAANGDLAHRLRTYVASARSTRALVSASTASGPGDHAASDAALPDGFSNLAQWITHELHDADINAVNLTAAQQVIEQDRQICSGALPGLAP